MSLVYCGVWNFILPATSEVPTLTLCEKAGRVGGFNQYCLSYLLYGLPKSPSSKGGSVGNRSTAMVLSTCVIYNWPRAGGGTATILVSNSDLHSSLQVTASCIRAPSSTESLNTEFLCPSPPSPHDTWFSYHCLFTSLALQPS